MKYVGSNGNPKLSWDSSFEDIVNRALDEMWNELKGAIPDEEDHPSPKKESTIRLVQMWFVNSILMMMVVLLLLMVKKKLVEEIASLNEFSLDL